MMYLKEGDLLLYQKPYKLTHRNGRRQPQIPQKLQKNNKQNYKNDKFDNTNFTFYFLM